MDKYLIYCIIVVMITLIPIFLHIIWTYLDWKREKEFKKEHPNWIR